MSGPEAASQDAAKARAAVEVIAAIGARSRIAQRLDLGSSGAVLRSVVEAAVALFEAEAASLALHDPARDVLVFRVAAGEQGEGVVGREITPGEGLVGFAFSTGQAIALSDVAGDQRFGRAFAQATGYVPRSIVAVPLTDDDGTIGVLEVLDKRTQAAFSLRDVELAAVFARQATVAIRASRVERDTAALLRAVVSGLAGADIPSESVDALVAAGMAELGGEDDLFWRLVEQIAAIRWASPDQLDLVANLLAVLAKHAARDRRQRSAMTAGGGITGPEHEPPESDSE